MSVNKVILVGRLGQDPELRYTPSSIAVCNFSVATNESWTDKQGQKQERTEWHRVVVWSKLAELCNQYLAKGRQVYIEGRMQTRQWQDQSGQTRYTTEVQAQTVQFLGGQAQAGAGAGAGAGYGASSGGPEYGAPGAGAAAGASGDFGGAPQADQQGGGASFTEDDIPF